MKKTNILVTGSTGFIGKQLVYEFGKPKYKKKYRIFCFVRKPVNNKCIIGSLEDRNFLTRIKYWIVKLL